MVFIQNVEAVENRILAILRLIFSRGDHGFLPEDRESVIPNFMSFVLGKGIVKQYDSGISEQFVVTP